MKDFLKNTTSLFIALGILLGILFLPDADFRVIDSVLEYISHGTTTAGAFGNYLVQKALTGFIVFVITVYLAVIAHRKFSNKK